MNSDAVRISHPERIRQTFSISAIDDRSTTGDNMDVQFWRNNFSKINCSNHSPYSMVCLDRLCCAKNEGKTLVMWTEVADDRRMRTALRAGLILYPDSNGSNPACPVLTREARGGFGMATVFSPESFNTQKVRFAHRYKMVAQKVSASHTSVYRPFRAEAPDSGLTRRSSEAGEMWTRNAEAPDAGGRR